MKKDNIQELLDYVEEQRDDLNEIQNFLKRLQSRDYYLRLIMRHLRSELSLPEHIEYEVRNELAKILKRILKRERKNLQEKVYKLTQKS